MPTSAGLGVKVDMRLLISSNLLGYESKVGLLCHYYLDTRVIGYALIEVSVLSIL
jgi:hypothetical protein